MRRLIYISCLIFLTFPAISQVVPDPAVLKLKAPEKFTAEFKTTKGDFIIEVIRDWSPMGADRLYQLILTGFYNNNSIFRVQPDYVVQFGICDDSLINYFWDKKPISDEPVREKNLKYTISYARDGANSRTVQLFINKKDNFKLDTINYNGSRGFTPVARVIKGQEVIEQFFGGYGFDPANYQDSIMQKGNEWLRRKFPQTDYILSARIME